MDVDAPLCHVTSASNPKEGKHAQDETPVADHHYAVVGTLGKESSSIWIEDIETHAPVTEKITSK